MKDGSRKYILAVDHGTSGAKTAIVSTHGKVIDFEYEETPLYLSDGGGAEQNPDEWWTAIKNTSKKLIDKELVPVEDIVGVCCSSQWSGTVPVDKNGNHIHNAIIWMDTRGAPHIKRLAKSRFFNISGYSITAIIKFIRIVGGGPGLSGKDPIAHILFLKFEKPDIYNSTYKFLECKDFLNLKFTGKFAASFDSIHLHWVTDIRDLMNIHYYDPLIKRMKLDKEKLPDLKFATDVLAQISPKVADEIGLSKKTKLIMGSPDVPSAIIGSGAVNDYEPHVYIGTSSWLTCHVPFKKSDIAHRMVSLPSPIPNRYYIGNEQEIAGGCLTFLRDNILYHKDELLLEEEVPDVYKIFDKVVETVPAGSNNLIFTPWLYGERTPVEDHTVRGTLMNVSLKTNRREIIRAIFEGVAFNSKWLLKYVEKFAKKPKLDNINMIGGGANSNVWCQIFADVLNRNIRQVKDPIQANARGAAFIASVGLGYIDWKDIAKHTEFVNIYKPNPKNRGVYDKLFKEFVNIYENNKKMFRRMNRRK